MQLEHLCDLELAYTSLIAISPFGGEDGVAYGEGEGEFRGERLTGRARWSNHPKRRSDGVYLPDAHGAIETNDGASVLFHLRGRTRMESDVGLQNLVATFESEDDRYAWLKWRGLPGGRHHRREAGRDDRTHLRVRERARRGLKP